MNGPDMRTQLEREAGRFPPPPDTTLDQVLSAGRRRQRRGRVASATAAAAVLVIAIVAVVGWPGASSLVEPVVGPTPAPFGPTFAAVEVCEPGSADESCPPARPDTLDRVRRLIEDSPQAEVVETITPEDRLAQLPDDHRSSQFIEQAAARVVIEIGRTDDPQALFRALHDTPGVGAIVLGTADAPPPDILDQLLDESPSTMPTAPSDHAVLEAPVAGNDERVAHKLWDTPDGQICLTGPTGGSCGRPIIEPGLAGGGAGPFPRPRDRPSCVHYHAGYDAVDVTVLLDGTTPIETTTRSARHDLPFLQVGVACWTHDARSVTVVARGRDGNEIARRQYPNIP